MLRRIAQVCGLALLCIPAGAQSTKIPGTLRGVVRPIPQPPRRVLHKNPEVERIVTAKNVKRVPSLSGHSYNAAISFKNIGTEGISALDFIVEVTYSDRHREQFRGAIDFLRGILDRQFDVPRPPDFLPGTTYPVTQPIPTRFGTTPIHVTAFPVAVVLENDTGVGDQATLDSIARRRAQDANAFQTVIGELQKVVGSANWREAISARRKSLESTGQRSVAAHLAVFVPVPWADKGVERALARARGLRDGYASHTHFTKPH